MIPVLVIILFLLFWLLCSYYVSRCSGYDIFIKHQCIFDGVVCFYQMTSAGSECVTGEKTTHLEFAWTVYKVYIDDQS